MKRHYILWFLFAVSLLLFLGGISSEREIMKLSTIVLTVCGLAAIAIGWLNTSFISRSTRNLQAATAMSKGFVFLACLMYAVFLWNAFLWPVNNMDFALFGSLFLSLVIAKVFDLEEIESYIGKKI